MAEKLNVNAKTKVFELPIDVTAAGEVSKTLATADTYVDRNIKVTVRTPDADLKIVEAEGSGAITATVSTTDKKYTSDTVTPHAITIAADAHVNKTTVGVSQSGFLASTDTIDIAAADAVQNTKTIYIKEGAITATGKATATGNVALEPAGAAPESGFYIRAAAAGSAKVTTAGWVEPGDPIKSSGDAYYTLPTTSFDNKEVSGKTYEDIDGKAPVLVEGGYLYIGEGYIRNSKISLAKLVPDHGTLPVVDAKSEWMYKGYSAYDNEGKLVAGTMGDAVLGDISATNVKATVSTVSVAANEGVFKVTGSGDISGKTSVAVTQRGLATTDMSKIGDVAGTANVEATLAKIGLTATADKESAVVKPVITKDTSTAKSGAITTIQPTSGKYVAVSAAAIAESVTVTPTVATEGYGTADLHSATAKTIAVGTEASDRFYIPLSAGSHSASVGTPVIVNATATVAQTVEKTAGFEGNLAVGILSAAPSGEYITLKANATKTAGSLSGNVTCAATEGYIEASSVTKTVSGSVDVNVTAAADKYIRVYDGAIL